MMTGAIQKYAVHKTYRIVQTDVVTLTFTTYNQHFNLYYISQFVIKVKAPMYGDFTFTVQPMLLNFNTVTCPIGPNHATVTDQHKCFIRHIGTS